MSDELKLTRPFSEPWSFNKNEEAKGISKSSKPTPEQIKKVAEDFEALFILNMLKELDKTTKLTEKGYMQESYMSIIYDKVSQFLAKSNGIGIKEMLMRYAERGIKF